MELRWFEYEAPDGCRPAAPTLQYRTIINPLELGLREPIWSEWKDVPTEIIESPWM